MSRALRLAEEAQAVLEAADRQNRPLSPDERVHVEGLLDRAREHGEMEKSLKETLGGLDDGNGMTALSKGAEFGANAGPGDMFVKSEGGRASLTPPGAASSGRPVSSRSRRSRSG
jgi:hypothetical protein